MLKKGSILYSVIKFKCPRCQEGEFLVSNPYNLKKAGEIREYCNVCGLKYSKEPGFYYGAMYVSYALAVALFVTLWTSFNLFFKNIPIGWQIGIIVVATLVLTPYLYALSKIIWANIFIKYDKDARRDKQGKINS
jgi:uncharacterized protein (DUF983 family)